MKNIHLAPTIAFLFILAACNQHSAQSENGNSATSNVMSSEKISRNLIEAPIDVRSNAVQSLDSSQSINGEFVVPRGGAVTSFNVQVGNFGNSSDGILTVHACQEDKCANGSGDLVTSKDNTYFEIPFAGSLTLTSGHTVKYVITRSSGRRRFAVYTYPSVDQFSNITLSDGKVLPRTLKVGLGLRK